MRLRLGVIGGGLISQVAHLPHLSELHDRFNVVALAEPSRRVREALALKYRIPRGYDDFRALLDVGGLDAVLVCSPNGTHGAVVLAALEAGLHVFVEKPLCITPADAERIIAARDHTRKVVQVGYMKRYDLAYESLIEDLEPGGEPLQYLSVVTYDPRLPRFFSPRGMPAPDDVPRAAAERTHTELVAQVVEAVGSEDPEIVRAFSDVFLGALVHDVNLCHGVLERLGEHSPRPVLDGATWSAGGAATLGLDSGGRWVIAWLDLPGLHDFRERIELYFSHSIQTLTFPAPYVKQAKTTYERTTGSERLHSISRASSYAAAFIAELVHFHACVTQSLDCITPPEQARADLDLLTTVFQASIAKLAASAR